MADSWSDVRIRNFIISVLRAGTRRWPAKYETLKEALVGVKLNKKTKRQSKHYKCNACKKSFPTSEVQVDHIIEVVDPETGFVDWNTYIPRLFCSKENFQILCKPCHSKKTQKARLLGKNSRQKKKEPPTNAG